jgi:prevent-host-death family protein
MKEVAVYEAKARLSDLLAEVEHGDEITITRRGVAVARLVSAVPREPALRQRERVAHVINSLKQHRKSRGLDQTLRHAVEQGRD